jgi:3-dehydroquinate dehydratase-1
MSRIIERPFIAGLISQDVLDNAIADPAGTEAENIKKCLILEIRYDLFRNENEWNLIAKRVFELNPEALRLGSIRLEKDGGKFKDERAGERAALFTGKFLDWIDIEKDEEFSWVKKTGLKAIRSWHSFNKILNGQELNAFADECLDLKFEGCKVATTARSKNDMQILYDFAKKYKGRFELFSAFAMGEECKESRIRSLKEGTNLAYASIGEALAPGQFKVNEMLLKLQFETTSP